MPLSRGNVRVEAAQLFFKSRSNEQWRELDVSSTRGTYDTFNNVKFIQFSGGIEVCQEAPRLGPDGGQFFKLRFDTSVYKDVWIDEYQKQGFDKTPCIAICFRLESAPIGSHERSTNLPVPGGKKRKVVAEPQASPFITDLSKIPLARISNNFDEDQYTEILMVFPRRLSTKKAAYNWSWPAAVHFLLGHEQWDCPTKTKEEKESVDKMSLKDVAKIINQREGHVLRAADKGYWLERSLTSVSAKTPILPARALSTEELPQDGLSCEVANELAGVDDASMEDPDTLAQLSNKIDQEEMMQKAAVEHLEGLKLHLAKKQEEVHEKEMEIQARSARLDSFREMLKQADRTEDQKGGEGGSGESAARVAAMEENTLGMDALAVEEGAGDAKVDEEAAWGRDVEEGRVRNWAEEMNEDDEGGVRF